LRATWTFVDFYGIKRIAGQEWLVTVELTSSHIIDVYEELIGAVRITVLNSDEFCYIQDPLDKESG